MHLVVHIAIIEWRHRSMYLKLSMNCEQIYHNSYECRGLFPLACLKHADKKFPHGSRDRFSSLFFVL